MKDIERLREIFYDIQKINEKINLSIWYCFLAMCLSSASLFGIYSQKSQSQAIQEMVVLYTSKPKCSVSSSSPSDLVPTSPKVSLSPFPPKRTLMFAEWNTCRQDHCQYSNEPERVTPGQDNNLSRHYPR